MDVAVWRRTHCAAVRSKRCTSDAVHDHKPHGLQFESGHPLEFKSGRTHLLREELRREVTAFWSTS
jgi:hypothetical protein